MTLVLVVVLAWCALSALGLLGVVAVCRSGHVEDVARGFDVPLVPGAVPAPRQPGEADVRPEVTH